jgi:hypothetical protein
VDEIDEVDRIYFGNIEINLRDDISYSDLNDEDDEDCESDKENVDSSTSNIGVECSELDLCESETQIDFNVPKINSVNFVDFIHKVIVLIMN